MQVYTIKEKYPNDLVVQRLCSEVFREESCLRGKTELTAGFVENHINIQSDLLE